MFCDTSDAKILIVTLHLYIMSTEQAILIIRHLSLSLARSLSRSFSFSSLPLSLALALALASLYFHLDLR